MADLSQPLLGAGASAKTDWAKAEAKTSLTFSGVAEFRRGFEIEIGLDALASASGSLNEFINATARGNAFAEAKASLRCQLPLNLFDDFGIAVGAQASAQAAAQLEVGLGLLIGDFVALLRQNPESKGLPLDLVLLLIEEVSIGGVFRVQVAAAAMAYASLQITGEVVKDPGFHYTVDAGLGLAAGVGFGGSLDLGFKDFRRFYGRAVDRTVDTVVETLSTSIPGNDKLLSILQVLSPTAKMSLRLAYELGDYIARNNPGSTNVEAQNLANHSVGIILEEAQRYLFNQYVKTGQKIIKDLLDTGVTGLPPNLWEQLRSKRESLAKMLGEMPADPFQPESQDYWTNVISLASDLMEQLNGGDVSVIAHGISILYAATTLLLKAVASRINTAQSYAFAIGAGRATVSHPSFSGDVPIQPRQIRSLINQANNENKDKSLDYTDLIKYLVSDDAISALLITFPVVKHYLEIFPEINKDTSVVLRTLLVNQASFMINGNVDPKATLQLLLKALDTYINEQIIQDLVPEINKRIVEKNVKLYFNEVIISTLTYITQLVFVSVLEWDSKPVDKPAFTESLSGVMTMLLGRSLVLVGDGFMTALQDSMKNACLHAANQLEGEANPFKAIGIEISPSLMTLFKETIRIGGEVFGPLPDKTRQQMRTVMYEIMETLPPSRNEQTDLLEKLADEFFIPNKESLDKLGKQLQEISAERFELFVNKVVLAFSNIVLEMIEELIDQVFDEVNRWAQQLEDAIQDLLRRLQQLDIIIRTLHGKADNAYQDTLKELEKLFKTFSNKQLRKKLRDKMADSVYEDALVILRRDNLYLKAPVEVKQHIRGVMRATINEVIEGPLTDPIFSVLGKVSGKLGKFMDEAQKLDLNRPLAPQLMDILMGILESLTQDIFGSQSPRIVIGFPVDAFGFRAEFKLGEFNIHLSTILDLVRDTLDAVDFIDEQLTKTAQTLLDYLQTTAECLAREDTRKKVKAEKDRLALIKEDYKVSNKTITIKNPKPFAEFSRNSQIEIHLGGTRRSYLGLNDGEQERVLVFINGNRIAREEFNITDTHPLMDTSPRGPEKLPSGITLKFSVEPSQLVVGGNTLAVVVVDPNNKKIEKSVCFIVARLNGSDEKNDLPYFYDREEIKRKLKTGLKNVINRRTVVIPVAVDRNIPDLPVGSLRRNDP